LLMDVLIIVEGFWHDDSIDRWHNDATTWWCSGPRCYGREWRWQYIHENLQIECIIHKLYFICSQLLHRI